MTESVTPPLPIENVTSGGGDGGGFEVPHNLSGQLHEVLRSANTSLIVSASLVEIFLLAYGTERRLWRQWRQATARFVTFLIMLSCPLFALAQMLVTRAAIWSLDNVVDGDRATCHSVMRASHAIGLISPLSCFAFVYHRQSVLYTRPTFVRLDTAPRKLLAVASLVVKATFAVVSVIFTRRHVIGCAIVDSFDYWPVRVVVLLRLLAHFILAGVLVFPFFSSRIAPVAEFHGASSRRRNLISMARLAVSLVVWILVEDIAAVYYLHWFYRRREPAWLGVEDVSLVRLVACSFILLIKTITNLLCMDVRGIVAAPFALMIRCKRGRNDSDKRSLDSACP